MAIPGLPRSESECWCFFHYHAAGFLIPPPPSCSGAVRVHHVLRSGGPVASTHPSKGCHSTRSLLVCSGGVNMPGQCDVLSSLGASCLRLQGCGASQNRSSSQGRCSLVRFCYAPLNGAPLVFHTTHTLTLTHTLHGFNHLLLLHWL